MSTLSATAPFTSVLTSLDELRGFVPPPSELACRKAIDQALEDSYRNTLS